MGGKSGSWRTSALPSGWRHIRARILARDLHRCRIRGQRCIGLATEVDHIGDAADHRDENLRAACEPCHRERSQGQARAAATAALRARGWSRRAPERHPGMR